MISVSGEWWQWVLWFVVFGVGQAVGRVAVEAAFDRWPRRCSRQKG